MGEYPKSKYTENPGKLIQNQNQQSTKKKIVTIYKHYNEEATKINTNTKLYVVIVRDVMCMMAKSLPQKN